MKYNNTVVKLNLKKLSDSFHMCPRSALSYLVELVMAFLQLEHTPIWFERKKTLGLAWLTKHLYQEQGIFFTQFLILTVT